MGSETPAIQQIIDRSSHCMVEDCTGKVHSAVKAKISDLRLVERHVRQLESAMKVAEEALRRLHTCIDFCNGHGTPRIKDRAECYMADAEAESALRAIEKIKKGGV